MHNKTDKILCKTVNFAIAFSAALLYNELGLYGFGKVRNVWNTKPILRHWKRL